MRSAVKDRIIGPDFYRVCDASHEQAPGTSLNRAARRNPKMRTNFPLSITLTTTVLVTSARSPKSFGRLTHELRRIALSFACSAYPLFSRQTGNIV
jgi:hypothetical protein